MSTFWFTILALMVATYVILDGFDFGAGILHLLVAHTDEERRTVLAAIGPVWDGNEVWLLASGGMLVYIFPRVYSAGFSGFYMPLMMVLWLLILRGISIEFRSLQKQPLWRSFWDGTFWLSSTLMAIVLGAALGNVIRGVPLDSTGFFSGPLFTNFLPGPHPGVLDWYTVLVGVFTLAVLGGHGALYLAWKTSGPVHERSQKLAGGLWVAAIVLGVLATVGTLAVQPMFYAHMIARPISWILIPGVVISLVLIFVSLRRKQELQGFLGSCLFLASMLAGAATAVFPNMLTSTLGESYNLTVFNAAAGGEGPRVALVWWTFALVLALGYFSYLFYSFRGKVKLSEDGHGY